MLWLRWVLVAITVTCVAADSVYDVTRIAFQRAGRSGFVVQGNSTVISAVQPHSAASEAGLRPGDVLQLDRMSLRDILESMSVAEKAPGKDLRLVVLRNGRYLDISLRPRSLYSDAGFAVVGALQLLAVILIAALLVLVLIRSPGVDAMILWAFASLWALPLGFLEATYVPDGVLLLAVGLTDVRGTLFATGAILLALQATRASAHRRVYERGVLGAAVVVLGIGLATDGYLLIFRTQPTPLLAFAASNTLLVVYVIVGAIVAAGLMRSSGAVRIRQRWFAVGLATIAVRGMLVHGLDTFAPSSDAYAVWPDLLSFAILMAGFGAIAFAIARKELFDVGFIINRTAIYAVLTALTVSAFAAINWLLGVVLKTTGLALPIEVILAGMLGLSLHVVRRRIDRTVELVFYRKRHDARRRLLRVGRGLGHAPRISSAAETVASEVCESLDLAGGAIFRLDDDGDLHRLSAFGWPPQSANLIACDDRLMVHLAGIHDWLRLDEIPHDAHFPHGHPRPRIAFPLWSRGKLAGVALFSAHKSGALLDPEEVDSVERMAGALVAAFDRIDAESLRTALAELQAEHDRLLTR